METTLLKGIGQYMLDGIVFRAGLVAASFDQNWVAILISFEEDDDGYDDVKIHGYVVFQTCICYITIKNEQIIL